MLKKSYLSKIQIDRVKERFKKESPRYFHTTNENIKHEICFCSFKFIKL